MQVWITGYHGFLREVIGCLLTRLNHWRILTKSLGFWNLVKFLKLNENGQKSHFSLGFFFTQSPVKILYSPPLLNYTSCFGNKLPFYPTASILYHSICMKMDLPFYCLAVCHQIMLCVLHSCS